MDDLGSISHQRCVSAAPRCIDLAFAPSTALAQIACELSPIEALLVPFEGPLCGRLVAGGRLASLPVLPRAIATQVNELLRVEIALARKQLRSTCDVVAKALGIADSEGFLNTLATFLAGNNLIPPVRTVYYFPTRHCGHGGDVHSWGGLVLGLPKGADHFEFPFRCDFCLDAWLAIQSGMSRIMLTDWGVRLRREGELRAAMAARQEESELMLKQLTHSLRGPLAAAGSLFDGVKEALLRDHPDMPKSQVQSMQELRITLSVAGLQCRSFAARRATKGGAELMRRGMSRGEVPFSELPALVTAIAGGAWLSGVRNPATEWALEAPSVDQVPEGDRVVGTLGDWADIVYTLLRNAFQEAGRPEHRASRPFVHARIVHNYDFVPRDPERFALVEVSNMCSEIPSEKLAVMQRCLSGEQREMGVDPAKEGSSGVGLGIVGETVKRLGGKAVAVQRGGVLTIQVRKVQVNGA